MTDFWSRVDRRGPDECWMWLGPVRHKAPRDYGVVRVNGRQRPAHVVAWELANDQSFPEGMLGCHHCDVPRCVNPSHIFPGTMSDNIRDAVSKGHIRFAGTDQVIQAGKCLRGHDLTPENTYIFNYGRRCRTCERAKAREINARNRGARRAAARALREAQS